MINAIDAKEKQKQFILNEGLWKVMAQLSWPAVVAMVLYGFNAVLDAIFVGQFVNDVALAGVSLAYPLSQISTAFGSLIGVGAGSVLSIAIGAKDIKTQRNLLGVVNRLSIICAILYMVVAFVFAEPLIAMMGGQGEALAYGVSYFRICTVGAFFWIYGLAGNMIIRAEGRMKTAAWMMGVGLIVNAVFNYIFMVIFNMGVEGAAWGTNVGMFVYTLMGWIYFGRDKATFQANLVSLKGDREITSSVVRLGMPSLIMSIMSLIQGLVVFNALARYGTIADIAFYGVVYRVFQFLLTPIFGLMRALQPVIGINYGAKQYDRVIRSYKIFAAAALLLTLPFWIISLVTPGSILGMMLKDQVFTGTQFLYFRVYMAILPVLSFIFMAMTLFPAIDKSKPAMIIGIARQVVFYIPVMLFLPKVVGVSGIYYGSLAIDAVIVLWTMLLVKKEFNRLRENKI
ncbi:MATE family efflux transporter [Faecalicatena contorta]|uniref:Multidrug export protein MepA n=1 Tax=Faecalicatena contorta TaxID=39482 RepID=A0A315ZZ02_9FIRM|nr:MATE family efflux transporter [Faecalicatena contorta]PWJ50100.1 putative MATE family efflux protein [Faecalicatena contorta]SUQ14221.1 putative efflux protein, MATE family [Faecalicatena contorta]